MALCSSADVVAATTTAIVHGKRSGVVGEAGGLVEYVENSSDNELEDGYIIPRKRSRINREKKGTMRSYSP